MTFIPVCGPGERGYEFALTTGGCVQVCATTEPEARAKAQAHLDDLIGLPGSSLRGAFARMVEFATSPDRRRR